MQIFNILRIKAVRRLRLIFYKNSFFVSGLSNGVDKLFVRAIINNRVKNIENLILVSNK